MDFNAIIKRVIAIITKPVQEWQVIKDEKMTVADMYTKYAIILAAIPAIAGFLGYKLIGVSTPLGTFRFPIGNVLGWSVLNYILSLGAVYLMALIIDFLAPNFGSTKNMEASLKVAIFSNTAAWVAGVFYLIPSLAILAVVGGLYSLYLLYLGIKGIKEPAADKATVYFVAVIIAQIVVGVIIAVLLSNITMGGYSPM
jgi:hypothetical protein